MALHWNIGKINDKDDWVFVMQVDDGEERKLMNPVTHQLLFVTMTIGMGNWTKAKIKEVFYRVRTYEMATGALFKTPPSEAAMARRLFRLDTFDANGLLSFAEVERHIGLATNVSNESDVWWKNSLERILRREVSGTIPKPLTKGASK